MDTRVKEEARVTDPLMAEELTREQFRTLNAELDAVTAEHKRKNPPPTPEEVAESMRPSPLPYGYQSEYWDLTHDELVAKCRRLAEMEIDAMGLGWNDEPYCTCHYDLAHCTVDGICEFCGGYYDPNG